MDTTKAVTHVSLCAGYGGIDLGLKRAVPNLRTIAFSEIEAFACANLVAKMEAGLLDAAPVWTNLKTFPWAEFRGKVGILSGGYPCQPFSAAGKRLGKDDPRHLWPFIADGIRLMRPNICFFENVEGHISLGLRDVIGELGSIGYRTTWGIFSASEVGATHQRKRVFILAHSTSWRGESMFNRNTKSENDFARCHWPSRPSQPQFEWEPPRVVANSSRSNEQQWEEAIRRTKSDGAGTSVGNADCNGRRELNRELRCGDQRTHSDWAECQGFRSSVAQSASVGNAAELQRDGGDDNAGVSQRSEAVSQPRDAGGQEPMGNAKGERSAALGAEYEGQRGELCAASASRQSVVGNANNGRQSSGIHAGCGGQEACGRENNPKSSNGSVVNASGEGRGEGRNTAGEGQGLGPAWADGSNGERGETKPSLGGDANGPACGLDYAQLCISGDSRVDELRLLGNGVVPACAERAFRTLMARFL